MLENLPFPLVIILVLLCAGFFAWLVSKVPAISEPYKSIALGVVGFGTVIWLIIIVYNTFFSGHVSTTLPHR